MAADVCPTPLVQLFKGLSLFCVSATTTTSIISSSYMRNVSEAHIQPLSTGCTLHVTRSQKKFQLSLQNSTLKKRLPQQSFTGNLDQESLYIWLD